VFGPRSPLTVADAVTQWRPDLLTLAVLTLVVVGYVRARHVLRAAGRPWPATRDALFAVGILLAAWVTSGFPEARAHQLMWMWTAQQLALLLAVPVVIMAAQPVALARTAFGPRALPVRTLESPFLRVAGHPALGMLYVPVVSALLLFGGVGSWAVQRTPGTDLLHVVLLALGAVIALPLVDVEDRRTSLAVGLAVAIGALELLVDAVPGIVLRLETHLVMPPFGIGRPPWAPSWLADQQAAGGILWTVAELLDMPFLVLMIVQWMRVERREARLIDAELDRAERTRPNPVSGDPAAEHAGPAAARPWWLDDPELRARYGRGQR
jgi:putative copper resistance protein D